MNLTTPDIVDALPYCDTNFSEEQREFAEKLVEAEYDNVPPEQDIHPYLPSLDNISFYTPLMAHGYSQIEGQNEKLPNDLDVLDTDKPSHNSASTEQEFSIWSRSLNQVKIKLEYYQRQMTNLDLIKSYGVAALEQYFANLETIESELKLELDGITKKTKETNWKRKNDHEKVAKTLDILRHEWSSFAEKNHELSKEIKKKRELSIPR